MGRQPGGGVAALVFAGLLGAAILSLPASRGTAEPPATVAAEVEMIAVDEDGARYWPRWRGPSGQGVVEGTGYPDTWSAQENVRWKVPVPGAGNSSPIVWGNHIFVTSAFEGGRQLAMLAFSREDGALLWRTDIPRPSVPESPHGKNGHASSTPSTDGERVYAYLGNHGIVAIDVSGKILWHRDLGQILASHGTAFVQKDLLPLL